MKPKRILTAYLTVLLLTSTLASCSRRDQFRPPETDVPTGEQTTVAGQPDVSNPTETNPTDTNQNGGDVTDSGTTTPDIPIGDPSTGDAENGKITGNPYEGWTAEELYASFMEDQARSSVGNNTNGVFGNTPYYVILDVQYGGAMFSKLTGQVVKICKDPLCDHEACIFSNVTLMMRSACQVINDRIYLTLDKANDKTVMYSFDLLMNDAEVVYEWNGADQPTKVYVYQNKIYYNANMKFDDGQYDRVTMVYDMKEKTTCPLREKPVHLITWHQGSYEWYTNKENGTLGRYNLDTGEDEIILDESWLNREAGEIDIRFAGVSDQTVYVWKNINHIFSNWLKYDMSTGEMHDMGSPTLLIYDENIYTRINHYVEENKNDPHYDYYQTYNNNTSSNGTKWGGKLYRYNAQTGEYEILLQLCTDGIPDNLEQILIMDGKYALIQYQTYKDFTNVYNTNIPEWANSRRYVVVNLETGTVYELGVDLDDSSYHKWLESHR